jgi:O-antigen biosynthesis protein
VKLSVIIVNYNVRHFLIQCLASVSKAIEQIDAEIIVVDNASVDDSVEQVRKLFPAVVCISLDKNLGFSKANNLAARQAKGEYLLLLNPDTLVAEDCFSKCIEYLDSDLKAGALGVKMIDGSGNYLPESKRGLPDLWTSFCKMTGVYKLFPNSSVFNGYYAGHLDASKIQSVEVLTGAFMMIRRNVWEEVNGLDEDYFMYGEDIDLSYRILKSGYSNIYFPMASIIHYKGESTVKGSLNYVSAFYNAMILFTKKHYAGKNKIILISLLSMVIWFKALMGSIQHHVSKLRFIIIDLIAFVIGFYGIRYYWAVWYHERADYFNNRATDINLLMFAVIWMASFFYQGVYEKKYSLKEILIASVWGFVLSLIIYALFPESWRASRMLLILSFLWVVLYALGSRLMYNRIRRKSWMIGTDQLKRALVIGDATQFQKINVLLNQKTETFEVYHKHFEEVQNFSKEHWLDYIRINRIDELIFCQKNMDWKQIMDIMKDLSQVVDYKIMTEEGTGIVGSSSKNERGEIYSLDLDYNIAQKVYQRQKRLFDVLFSFILLSFLWLFVFLFKNKKQFVRNVFMVLWGKLTWVSYQRYGQKKNDLPLIKQGVLFPAPLINHFISKDLESQILNIYA